MQRPQLERLDVLVGEWAMAAGPAGEPAWPGDARVVFEWMRGGAFLVERWSVPAAFDGLAIIGAGDEPDAFRRHYFDGRGEARVYEMTFGDGAWTQHRDAPDPFPQRFRGTLDAAGTTISARWDKAPDGSTWEPDIDVTYTKLGSAPR